MRPAESTQAEVAESSAQQSQPQAQVTSAAAPQQKRFIPKPSDPESLRVQQEAGFIYVDANIYQAAMINKQLPMGYRIDLEDTVFKQIK